jgi:DHA2 family multidrug resistance protein
MAAIGCWMCAHMDSTWAGSNFEWIELLLATGFAATYVGLVGNIILEALEAGALTSAADAATISGLMHFVRIFGGQAGVATMTRLITVRERFHSNLLGLHVQVGSWITDERVRLLTAGLLPQSAGPDEAQARAIEFVGRQVRGQAFTLAVADGFLFIGCVVVAYLLLMLLLRPAKYSFNDLRKMQ